MHFLAIAAAAFVGSALANNGKYYEQPVYYTSSAAAAPYHSKVYTSISTCTEKAPYYHTPTSAPVYYAPSKAAEPVYEVTYTSYAHITITSCAAYVTNCPAKVYTSTAYSVSKCPYASSAPYYVPPANTTYAPAPYAAPYPTYTNTYYTTVCPGYNYCYGTTVTSTYCPKSTPVYVPTSTYCPPSNVPVYSTPVYTPVYSTPVYNQTTPVYHPPPSYTGAASSNAVSFGVVAIAGLVALFIAA